MSVQLQPNMTQNVRDIKICEDYWVYDNKASFIRHVKVLCEKYEISAPVLFETIAQCYAYLDDMLCEYCGYACPIEVPADMGNLTGTKPNSGILNLITNILTVVR